MGRDDHKSSPSGFPGSSPSKKEDRDSRCEKEHDEGDDPFDNDRITAVPAVPMSDMARRLMAETESDPSSFTAPDLGDDEFELGSAIRDPSDAPPETRRPTVKESLSSPNVPQFEPDLMPDDDMEFDPDSESDPWDPGRAAAPPPAPEEFGPLNRPASLFETDPPAAAPSRGDADAPFDFEDFPSRHEMPTLDIGDEVDDLIAASALLGVGEDGRDTTPDNVAGALAHDTSELFGDTEPRDRTPRRETDPAPSSPSDRRTVSEIPGLPLRERSGLDLADEPPPAASEGGAYKELHDRYAVGDFTGALVIAESLLEQNPEDIEAKRYSQSCRDVLMQMYSARLGSLDQVVTVAIPPDQIRWLSLDHRAGFLLSLVDGMSSVDDILDICGMPRLDALRIMYQLLEQRVITVGQQ